MATIITRQVGYVGSQTQTAKSTPLTNAEIDQNFINLNVNKVELNGSGAALTALNAGNISTGTLAVARGGSGQTTYTDGQLLIGNTVGNTLSRATLTAGTNVAITNGNGSISIATSATPSFTTVTTTGNVTLAGDIAVNGGDLTTTATTFNLVTSTATTLNIGGAATVLSVGAASGTLTINNTTLAAKAITASTTLDVTGVATFAAGSAALPSISRTGDTNTGMFFPAADTIAFAESGVESMRINSAGNLGIGTTNPVTKLDIFGGDLGTTNGVLINSLRLQTNTSNVDTLNFTKIRTSTGTTWESAAWRIQQRVDVSDQGYLQFNGTGNNGGLSLGTNNINRLNIDINGNTGITNSAAIGGTLGVTGATVLSSTLNVTGLATLGSVRAPGTVTQTVYRRVDTKVTYAIPAYVASTTPNGVILTDLDTTITPRFSNSAVLVNMCLSFEVQNDTIFKLFRVVGGVPTEIGTNSTDPNNWSGIWHPGYDYDNASTATTNTYFFYDTPGTTSAVTYRLMIQSAGVAATTFFLNRTVAGTGSANYEVAISQVILQEICQ